MGRPRTVSHFASLDRFRVRPVLRTTRLDVVLDDETMRKWFCRTNHD